MVSFLFVEEVGSVYGENLVRPMAYGSGYKLWMASGIVLLLGSLVAALPTEFLKQSASNAP